MKKPKFVYTPPGEDKPRESAVRFMFDEEYPEDITQNLWYLDIRDKIEKPTLKSEWPTTIPLDLENGIDCELCDSWKHDE